jgi:hypothetical protein
VKPKTGPRQLKWIFVSFFEASAGIPLEKQRNPLLTKRFTEV